ncbi:tRNA-adenosine deaminase [Pedobacter westerhofensis]|uniref:tRNA-adenosine deaminase n=1 Tax=Pedobacter westerhofensis TaxID=425512 RepID=A0A521FR08_9SPHI|nr:nucleoside deaminase [Pedobacter westerhofensis]SMO98639.1 tRNA-adenosine deaminase [Pedobacter westerhofensis]
MQNEYQHYMDQCLEIAKAALIAGNPPVGAIIVYDGKVIGTGQEAGKSTGDITNHAEILAIRSAIKSGYAKQLSMSQMYTTHEPCIMCSYMIRHHRIPEIIYGISVPDVGGLTSQFSVLSTEKVPKWGKQPTVISDICVEECKALNDEFLQNLNQI